MTSRKEKTLLATFAGVGAIVASFAASPNADASPLSFLGVLASQGVVVYDAQRAVAVGYDICAELDYRSHVDVTMNFYEITLYSDVPDMDTAALWVVAAGSELCPRNAYQGTSAGMEYT